MFRHTIYPSIVGKHLVEGNHIVDEKCKYWTRLVQPHPGHLHLYDYLKW